MGVGPQFQLLADCVLALHFLVVAFVVGGFALIVAGTRLKWRFVNLWRLRVAHLGAIAFVVLEAWLGATCPLTTLEMWLRSRARAATYHGSFFEHWVQRLLYYEAPSWMFELGYSLFGLLALLFWFVYPPRPRRGG